MGVASLYEEPEQPATETVVGALEFLDVFKIFGSGSSETVALRGLELRVEQGELVAVFGPSGSGKSTMLHLAAGLDDASAGEVRAFGRPLNRLGERALAAYRAREVAIVFQNGNLWAGLSARENVKVALGLAGEPDKARADEALDAFGLEPRARQRSGSLSCGEQ
ncbi:MAG: ABC transporter ATP-binding protein [Gaiellaceae bacterium]